MFYVSNYTLAVIFCVVTMFCWGSWGNTQKLAGKTSRSASSPRISSSTPLRCAIP